VSAHNAAISLVTTADLDDLAPLMRAYCDFYEVDPPDASLRALSEALIADPACEGVQLIARDQSGQPVGFATVYWSWSTLDACRLAVMNDLFVSEQARGSGLAEALIEACADHARAHDAKRLGWQTAKDNHRAQAVYERVGATRSQWLDYELVVAGSIP
jgi:GNAT superfamily N-acetyltransferase